MQKIKEKIYYARGITKKRITSVGAHFRDFAPWQYSSKRTSQHSGGGLLTTVSDLIGSGLEPKTSRADICVFNHHPYAYRPEQTDTVK